MKKLDIMLFHNISKIMFALLLCLCLQGCLTLFEPKGPGHTSNSARYLTESEPSWSLITLRLTQQSLDLMLDISLPHYDDRDSLIEEWVKPRAIIFKYHGYASRWFVKTGNGIDVWEYNVYSNVRKLLPGRKAQRKINYLTSEQRSALYSNEVLSIYTNDCVFIDIEQIFSDNAECDEIWLDDGYQGMRYFRGKPYSDQLTSLEGLYAPDCRVILTESKYKIFCEKIRGAIETARSDLRQKNVGSGLNIQY